MNNEHVRLPDFIIADIYKNHLIEPETDAITEAAKPQKINPVNDSAHVGENKAIKYLGQNKKQIALIVNEEISAFIDDEELQFLTKVLSACKLNLSDIAIINLFNNPLAFEMLQQELSTKTFLLFGISPTEINLPFNLPFFQVQNFSDCIFISSPPIKQMLLESPESISMKRELWGSLQKIFNLK